MGSQPSTNHSNAQRCSNDNKCEWTPLSTLNCIWNSDFPNRVHRIISLCDTVLKINEYEFILTTTFIDSKDILIYKYNTRKNEWCKFIKIPNRRGVWKKVFNENKQILYFINYRQNNLLLKQINIKNGERKTRHIGVSNNKSAMVVIHDDKPNIFTMTMSNDIYMHSQPVQLQKSKHFIWNTEENVMEESYENELDSLIVSKVIHLKYKKCLLMFGGNKKSRFSLEWITDKEAVYLYDLTKKSLQTIFIPYCYKEIIDKARKECIVSGKHDKYIFIILLHCIYVLNLETMKLMKSTICLPIQRGSRWIINMNDTNQDSILTFGYIRYLWSLSEYKNIVYPPYYLIKMISSYNSDEWIYLLDNYETSFIHWRIKLDKILMNCVAYK